MAISGWKGFDKDFKCRGYQYEVGAAYKTDQAEVCQEGFHFCEDALDVFSYYPPATSRYAEVEGDGEMSRHSDDSKIACTRLRIGAEVGLAHLISASIGFRFNRATWGEGDKATGPRGAASATGYAGAASATGEEGVASSLGLCGKAKGALGCWLVLAEWVRRDSGWHRADVRCAQVDGENIRPDTWYRLVDGQFTAEDPDK